jgi:hypothetical protein
MSDLDTAAMETPSRANRKSPFMMQGLLVWIRRSFSYLTGTPLSTGSLLILLKPLGHLTHTFSLLHFLMVPHLSLIKTSLCQPCSFIMLCMYFVTLGHEYCFVCHPTCLMRLSAAGVQVPHA